MRDFGWFDELYAVIKDNGQFAGVPCASVEEAKEIQAQHENSKIFLMIMIFDNCNFKRRK